MRFLIPDSSMPVAELPETLRKAILDSISLNLTDFSDATLKVMFDEEDEAYIFFLEKGSEVKILRNGRIIKELGFWMRRSVEKRR